MIRALGAPALLLESAGGQTRHDATLEEEHHEHQRQRHDDAGRHLGAEGRVELGVPGELRQQHRGRLHRGFDDHRDGHEELVPGADEDDDGGGEDARRGQWEDDLAEGLAGGASVDHGGLLELLGHLPEEARQVPHGQGQGEGQVRDDHRLVGVRPAPGGEVLQQGHDDGHEREHRGGDDEEHEQALAPEVEACQGVGGEGRHGQCHDRHDDRDDEGVDEAVGEVVLLGEDRLVVLEGGVAGPPAVLEDLTVGAQ